MAKVISKMSVMISGSARGLSNAFSSAGKSTKRFEKVVNKVNGRLRALQASAMRAATGLGAFLGIAGSFGALGFIVKTASDMEETMNKFNVVFGESAARVREFSDTIATQMGRSQLQIATFMASAQDLFMPLGFAADDAEAMSVQITRLTVDLASFNNMLDEDVFRDLSAALTGSGEVMKKYGVIVSEAAVKQDLLNRGIDPRHATNQQKVQSRLNIIMRGTTAAQGDAVRSMNSFANSSKQLKAMFSDLSVQMGTILLPTFTKMVKGLQNLIKWLEVNGKSIARTTVQVLAFAAGWTAVVVVLPKVFAGLKLLVQGIRTATIAIITLQGATGVGLVKVAAGLAVAAGQGFDTLIAGMDEAAASAVPASKAVDKVAASVKKVATEAKKAKIDLGFSGGDVGAARAGTTAGFSAVHSGRKHLLRMLQQMKEAQRERKAQTAALREIQLNTAEQITIKQARI